MAQPSNVEQFGMKLLVISLQLTGGLLCSC